MMLGIHNLNLAGPEILLAVAAMAFLMMVAASMPVLLGRKPAKSLRFFDLLEGP